VGVQDITLSLPIAGVRVTSQRQVGDRRAIVVERETLVASCPRGGRRVATVHDRRLRRKHDEPLGERTVTVAVVRRRFRGPWDRHVFTEPEAEVGGWRRRTPDRFRARLGQEGRRQPVQHVADRSGVSATTVQRAVYDRARSQAAATRAPVRHLGLDDFSLRRGRRYATGWLP
jgi:transposase